MTEKELVAKMLDTLVRSRKELANIDLDITKKSLPELDIIIEHLCASLMIMVMGEFSTGKSTFINAMVGEEVTAVNATPTTAVITKLCYGNRDRILVHFTDGTKKEYELDSFKQLTSKTGTENEDKTHENIEYVERQMPVDILQYVTIIDSPGLNDINEKHSYTAKQFVNNADTVFWMFNALHAGSKTEIDAMESLTPRLKPIAIINMMDELDEEEDDPQEFLDNLRVQLKDKVQAVVGISAKFALEGKLEKNETKTEIGNLKELERVVRELVLPNSDKYKLNTLMDELGDWVFSNADSLKSVIINNQKLKESDYREYLDNKAAFQKNEEALLHVIEPITEYGITESNKYNEQAMFFIGGLYYYGIWFGVNYDKAESFFESAALKNHLKAQEYMGVYFAHKNDLKKAFIWYQKAAEQGNAKAQFNLANCYMQGIGTDKDEKKAFTLIKESAELGNKYAQNRLGLYYVKGICTPIDEKKAFIWFQKAAKQNLDVAAYNLGYFFEKGRGTEKNNEKALYWYQIAASQGYERAKKRLEKIEALRQRKLSEEQYILAVKSANDGNMTKAFSFYKSAAEQGNAKAQYELANCYNEGLGTNKNDIQAYHWLRKAAEQGFDEAMSALGCNLIEGIGVEKNEREGFQWIQKAASTGDADSQYQLANCYFNGIGINVNLRKAFEWYKKAAFNGHDEAEYMLGRCYEKGWGVDNNIKKAFEWYKKAAENEVAAAQNNLGLCYFTGKGTQQDKKQAIFWFQKAAAEEIDSAYFNVAYCFENGYGTEKNQESALFYYRKAEELGYDKAKAKIALLEEKIKKNQAKDNKNTGKAYKVKDHKTSNSKHKKTVDGIDTKPQETTLTESEKQRKWFTDLLRSQGYNV